jgi:type IV pilus assembly protein PilQ
MIPVSYAKAATLAPRAQAFLSKRGKVDTDERTNTIIIRDVDAVIKRIQKVFAVLDTQPPAVSISAKFVEVKKDFTRTLGLGAMSLTGQTSGINFGVPGIAVPGLEAGPGFTANPTGGSINLSAPKFAALQAKLTLGETENQVRVLANPTITVQQGQKGNITQGTTTEIPQTLVQGGQGAVAGALQQTANLTLDVTPIVANDGSISLDTNLLQENPLPAQVGVAKDTRNIKTQIILKNGDTAVLGGVFLGRDTETNTGVPFLKNLPLLGYLFSSRVNITNRNEVLIFITARILNPESAFKQSL